MNKTIAFAMLAMFAATGAPAKETKSYQLLDSGGNAMCESFLLDQHNSGLVRGTLTGFCGQKDYVGGFYGGVRNVSGGPSWTILFRVSKIDPDAQFILVLNERDLTWTAFTQKDGVTSYGFLTGGTLEDTSGPARPGRSLNSVLKAAQLHPQARPAKGVDVHYTFAQLDGTPYCDGLALTQSAKLAVGTHTASSSCSEGEYAGGNYGYVKAEGEKVWTIVTTGSAFPGADLVYVLDENAMTWAMYGQQTGSIDFGPLGRGLLLLGDPVDSAAQSTASAAMSK